MRLGQTPGYRCLHACRGGTGERRSWVLLAAVEIVHARFYPKTQRMNGVDRHALVLPTLVMNTTLVDAMRAAFVAAWFAPALSLSAPAAQPPSVAVQSLHNLHTISYNSIQGVVHIQLPDDLAAGDRVSGSVRLEPSGQSESERTANTAILRGTVIDVGRQRISAENPHFSLQVPAAAWENIPVVIEVQRRKITTRVPIRHPGAVSMATAATPGFSLPRIVTAGSPTQITGSFDGDAANTQLSLGDQPLEVLAESPRQTIFQVPSELPMGENPLTVSDGPLLRQGTVRVVQVQLSAPKLDLLRGETTPLTVVVAGLQGLKHPVPFQLTTTGTVATEGGNLQRWDILPDDPNLADNGEFRLNRTVTGTAAGGFNIAAEVVWANPAPHWLAGGVLHVEGKPGGQPGRWRVPVIRPPDKRPFGIYFGGDKPPALQFCNWIEIGAAEEKDGVDFVGDYKRTTDPSAPPPKPKPPVRPSMPPPPAPSGGGTSAVDKPPPCKEGEERELSAEKKSFTLLDGKQEFFLQVYTDKDATVAAAGDFAAYLDTLAKAGKLGKRLLPKGEGAGGAVAGALVRYLGQGSATIEEVLKGKLRLAGASKFTAVMNAGLRDIEATCATVEICVRGVKVTEKRYTETETKRREIFSWVAEKGGDAWEKITDSSSRIDAKKAAAWANEQFSGKAEEFKNAADERQKFKDGCK